MNLEYFQGFFIAFVLGLMGLTWSRESTQATLQAGLTELADAVAALQTSLASAATAAEVAALQTALTNVQSDLTDLLASNNVYSPSFNF